MISPIGHCEPQIKHLQKKLDESAQLLYQAAITSGQPLRTKILPEHLPILTALLSQYFPKVVCIVSDPLSRQSSIQSAVQSWAEAFKVTLTTHALVGPLSEQERSGLITSDLSRAFHSFLNNPSSPESYIISSQLINQDIPDPESYQKRIFTLHTGEKHRLNDLVALFIRNGYTRFSQTLEPGGIRVLGDQIDVWHPANSHSHTISFYGEIIDRIVTNAQNRRLSLKHLTLPPVAFPKETCQLSKTLTNSLVLHPADLPVPEAAASIAYDALHPEITLPLQAVGNLATQVISRPAIVWYENLDRIQAFFRQSPSSHPVCLLPGNLARYTFALNADPYIVTSEAGLLPTTALPTPISYQEGLALLTELRLGHPAVHSDHGIGIYEGLQSRTIGDSTKDYLVLRYAGNDTLSVPVEYAYKVTAYLGDSQPVIHRLGGLGWRKSRQQAEANAAEFARELLETASARQQHNRPPYYLDEKVESNLSAGFPYTLTPDQVKAWEDIRKDLEREQPMDRLIVGDVGFGKTELAIRAAYHVAANGKQVALLAPTTLLVQQHTDTVMQRLPQLAGAIGTLSRFSSLKSRQDTRARIASGDIKIAVGTHALLSASTHWHNLGLVIIDEEQRFGVKQKEHFKKLRANLDILAMSATPIPRTLSMSLSGLKNLSLISTAPQGRKSVQTVVHSQTDSMFKEAIEREHKRSGQVYVVAPRVQGLASLAHYIQKLVPSVTVAIAHGQLPPNELSRIMHQFDTGALDVLVSSTIIENGIDLPNANTLIVTKATHYGLSDLYQLRGRVGRRERQGYAYFLYNQSDLSGGQRQRLTALTEAARLGSGWALAQRDLEIRGAGNFLGAEQSGSVNAVGIQFYLDLVQDYIHRQSSAPSHRDIEINVPFSTTIPDHYIADSATRVHTYQRLARARDLTALSHEIGRLTSAFGPLPTEAEQLVLVLTLQHHAARFGLTHLTYQTVTPSDEDPYFRLILTAHNPVSLLERVGSLGRWQVTDHKLTLPVNNIDPSFIRKLVSCLK